eukprot:1415954-Amphidinium_carterae.1
MDGVPDIAIPEKALRCHWPVAAFLQLFSWDQLMIQYTFRSRKIVDIDLELIAAGNGKWMTSSDLPRIDLMSVDWMRISSIDSMFGMSSTL